MDNRAIALWITANRILRPRPRILRSDLRGQYNCIDFSSPDAMSGTLCTNICFQQKGAMTQRRLRQDARCDTRSHENSKDDVSHLLHRVAEVPEPDTTDLTEPDCRLKLKHQLLTDDSNRRSLWSRSF